MSTHTQALPAAPGRISLPGIVQGLSAVAVLVGGGALGWAFSQGDAAARLELRT